MLLDLDAIRARNEARKRPVSLFGDPAVVHHGECAGITLNQLAPGFSFAPEDCDCGKMQIAADSDALIAEVIARRKDVRNILRTLGDNALVYGPDPDVTSSVTVDRAKSLVAEVERLRAIVKIDEALRDCDRKLHESRGGAILEGISEGSSDPHTGPALAAKIRKFNGSGER